MNEPNVPAGGYLPRHAEREIQQAMQRYRIVALIGPRQAGKTTLVRRIAHARNLPYASLDVARHRNLALADPGAFVQEMRGGGVIDEIQRAPELVLEIKHAVDMNPERGRYIMTGSVDFFSAMVSPDSLAGRVACVQLLPLSVAESLRRRPPDFLARAFSADFPDFRATGPTDGLWRLVVTGGFPEAASDDDPAARSDRLRNYASALARRDALQVSRLHDPARFARLIDICAALSGRIVDLEKLSRHVRASGPSVERWLSLLESMFVLRRIPAWHGNALRRLVKRPRLHFVDSGLAAAIGHQGDALIAQIRPGELLESFVYGEIAKAIAGRDIRISHFRDRNQNEVDLVIEQPGAGIVGLEVTAAAGVGPAAFSGLRHLQEAVGDSFSCGIVLHDGNCIQKVAPRMFAMPLKMLWEG